MTPYQSFVTAVPCTRCGAPIGELCRSEIPAPPSAARVHDTRVDAADGAHAERTGLWGHQWTLIPNQLENAA